MMPRLLATAAVLVLGLPAARAQDPAREGTDFFERKIRPVLADRCYSCHSHKAEKLKGNLYVDTREGLLKGGDLGPAVVPGHPEKSLLLQAIRHADPELKMPPKAKLPPEVVKDFEAWIVSGAPDPRHADAGATIRKGAINWGEARRYWAFLPVLDPPAPAVRAAAWPANAIDRFVLAKLEENGLRPVADADKPTLIRRVTFDLTGLPPTPEDVEAFLADASPEAYAKLVDRLLASPHYGERWGRHWLDVVRYADTAGDNSDYPVPQLYRYRNYVIRAFNEDKPFDRFVREQLAGDLLPAATEEERYEKIVATGYLASAKKIGSVVKEYPWHLTIEDTIDNLGRTFLGLTVNCSRCHDHKFDPISNEDYYALYGIFDSMRYPWSGIELDKRQRDMVPLVPPAAAAKALRELEAKMKALDEDARVLDAEKKAVERVAGGADDAEAARAKEHAQELSREIEAAKKQKDALERSPLPFPTAYAVAEGVSFATPEGKKPGNARVQIKGDPAKPGPEVPRRFLTVLGGQRVPAGEKGSGRLHLADWICDPANPLTARVLVNRLWHWHFGRGIVATPSDFGKQGHPPTHPELLDWLARRFIEGGFSVKAMHRLILLSRTYRLSSDESAANQAVDPDNHFLWRHRRRRLDAESIRDAVLAVSGGLDRSVGGPHPFPHPTTWDFTQHKPFVAVYDSNLRSVYLMTQRIRRHPFFGIFDGADTNFSTASRVTSTTTLQALYFMNDPLVHEQAKRFAARLARERPDPASRIDRAYRLALGRPPTSEERAAGLRHVEQARELLAGTAGADRELAAWESFARVVFRLNEFIYVR
jgi:hypothetical protein